MPQTAITYTALYRVTINGDVLTPVGAESAAQAAEIAQKHWVLQDSPGRSIPNIRDLRVEKLAELDRVLTQENIDYGRRRKK